MDELTNKAGSLLQKVLREDPFHRLSAAVRDGRPAMLIQVRPAGDGGLPLVGGPTNSDAVLQAAVLAEMLELESQGGVLSAWTSRPRGLPWPVAREDEDVPSRLAGMLPMVSALAELHELGRSYGLVMPGFVLQNGSGLPVLPEPFTLWLVCGSEAGLTEQARHVWLMKLAGAEPWRFSPEVLKGQRPPTSALDVYQICVWLSLHLTGVSPFGSGLAMEVANRAAHGHFKGLDSGSIGLSAELVNVLREGMSPDPGERIRDCRVLLERLLRVPECSGRERCHAAGEVAGPLLWYRGGEQLEPVSPDPDTSWKPAAIEQSDGIRLAEQLAALKPRTSAGPAMGAVRGRRMVWALAATAAALFLFFFGSRYLEDAPLAQRHEGRLPAHSARLTHDDMKVKAFETSGGHPTVELLLQHMEPELVSGLEDLGFSANGEAEFMPPVLPPFRVRVTAAGLTSVWEFTARSRLSTVSREPGSPMTPGPVLCTVLYDAGGQPVALVPVDQHGTRGIPVLLD